MNRCNKCGKFRKHNDEIDVECCRKSSKKKSPHKNEKTVSYLVHLNLNFRWTTVFIVVNQKLFTRAHWFNAIANATKLATPQRVHIKYARFNFKHHL